MYVSWFLTSLEKAVRSFPHDYSDIEFNEVNVWAIDNEVHFPINDDWSLIFHLDTEKWYKRFWDDGIDIEI